MKIKAMILILILLTDILFLPGCWNYKEINEVAMVAGCAIDKGREGKKYSITIEVITHKTGGGTEGGTSTEFYTEEGDATFEIIRSLILKVGRKLFWSHAKAVVLSSEVAEGGILPVLDWLSRDAETRSEMWVLVSREKTAKEILLNKVKINEISSFHINDIIRSHRSSTKILNVDILEATKDLKAEGVRMILPGISLEEQNGTKEVKLEGISVFKLGKLVGWLDENQTKSVIWLRDEVELGLITVKNALGTNSDIILEIFDREIKRKPLKENGKLVMEIEIKPDVSIAEIQGPLDVMKKDEMEKLRKQAEEQFKKGLEDVIRIAQQEFKADIFEFGLVFQRKMPKEWKKAKDNWDEEFSNLEVRIKVDFEIIGSATFSKPIKVGE